MNRHVAAGRLGGTAMTEAQQSARRTNVVTARAERDRRRAENPEQAAQISSANGKRSCSYVYRCEGCGRTFRGPAVFTHQKHRGHVGVTVLETPTKEIP